MKKVTEIFFYNENYFKDFKFEIFTMEFEIIQTEFVNKIFFMKLYQSFHIPNVPLNITSMTVFNIKFYKNERLLYLYVNILW